MYRACQIALIFNTEHIYNVQGNFAKVDLADWQLYFPWAVGQSSYKLFHKIKSNISAFKMLQLVVHHTPR